jgi:hypothetical protein
VLRNTIVQYLKDSKSSYNIYKQILNIKYCLKYTPSCQRLNIMEFKVSLMKRSLHGIKLSPPSYLLKQNVVPYTYYIAWYIFYNWFPTLISPVFYIELFKIINWMNIKYPIFYCNVISKIPLVPPPPAGGFHTTKSKPSLHWHN